MSANVGGHAAPVEPNEGLRSTLHPSRWSAGAVLAWPAAEEIRRGKNEKAWALFDARPDFGAQVRHRAHLRRDAARAADVGSEPRTERAHGSRGLWGHGRRVLEKDAGGACGRQGRGRARASAPPRLDDVLTAPGAGSTPSEPRRLCACARRTYAEASTCSTSLASCFYGAMYWKFRDYVVLLHQHSDLGGGMWRRSVCVQPCLGLLCRTSEAALALEHCSFEAQRQPHALEAMP